MFLNLHCSGRRRGVGEDPEGAGAAERSARRPDAVEGTGGRRGNRLRADVPRQSL